MPVAEPEEILIVRRKPWKGGSDGTSEASIAGRVAQKMTVFANKNVRVKHGYRGVASYQKNGRA